MLHLSGTSAACCLHVCHGCSQAADVFLRALFAASPQVRIFNLDDVRPIRDLDPIDIDSLVALKGMITRTGNIIPDLRSATQQF